MPNIPHHKKLSNKFISSLIWAFLGGLLGSFFVWFNTLLLEDGANFGALVISGPTVYLPGYILSVLLQFLVPKELGLQILINISAILYWTIVFGITPFIKNDYLKLIWPVVPIVVIYAIAFIAAGP